MVVEVTGIFRRIVHELEQRVDPEKPESGPDKNRILKTSKLIRDPFELKAVSIVDNIVRLRQFLSGNRDAYIDVVLNREHSITGLSDLERDKIDNGANQFIRTINQLIANFKKDLREATTQLRAQRMQHLEAVSDILEAELKSACRIYSEQKAIRMEKELQFQKLARLEVNARNSKRLQPPAVRNREVESVENDADEVFETETKKLKTDNVASDESENEEKAENSQVMLDYDEEDDNFDVSPEEEQMFKQENERMYEDLISLKDSVQQIESKVVRIAELQEIFTEKVLQQKDDIDLISQNTIGATENVKDGNEELRKAIQRNASIRVYILFFLLVMSFSLLFLDWYNE